MRRLPKLRFNKYIVFAILSGLIVAAGVGIGLYSRNQRQNAPQRSLEAFHASLNEIVLASSALRAIDGSNDSSPFAIASTQAALKNSLEAAQKLLGSHKNSLDTQYQSLEDALDQQQKSYEEFEAAYAILGKAISYNPSLDIGGLDISKHQKQIQERAFAANDNLFKLAETYEDRFNDEANQALNISVNCFGELSDLAKENKTNQLGAVRDRCVSTYQTTRRQLVSALLEVYGTDKAKTSLLTIKGTLSAASSN